MVTGSGRRKKEHANRLSFEKRLAMFCTPSGT